MRYPFRLCRSLAFVCFAIVLSGCHNHRVQLIDLITEEAIMDGRALHFVPSFLPISAFRVRGSYEADADGVIALPRVGTSDDIQFTSETRRGAHIGIRFTPEVTVGGGAWEAAKIQAVERWIKQQSRDDLHRIPLLQRTAFMNGPNDFGNADESERVTTLVVGGDTIADDHLDALQRFPNLRFLRITTTEITDAGLLKLQAYPELLSLDLYNNPGVTDAGVERVSALLPKTIVVRGKIK